MLPQADTRVAAATTGWAAFLPGTSLGSSLANTVAPAFSAAMPSIPSSCTGWTVDSSAGFTFPAGMWTFNRQLRPDAAASGAAVLTVAMWKVDTSGNTIPIQASRISMGASPGGVSTIRICTCLPNDLTLSCDHPTERSEGGG